MEGNVTPGRARPPCIKDYSEMTQTFQSFNRKTTLPQKLYCSIEMCTISPTAWNPVRCPLQQSDSWSHLPVINEDSYNQDSNPEIRYRQEQLLNYERTPIEYAASSEEDFNEEPWDTNRNNTKTDDGVPGVRARKNLRFRGRVGRNARERRRVRAVSGAFLRLRRAVPHSAPDSCGPSKRLSKLKTLKGAINYIQDLQKALYMTNNYSQLYSNVQK